MIKRKQFNLLEMAINPSAHHIKKVKEQEEESKLFARRDYEGLTGDEKYTLSQERSKVAKELAKKRNKISKSYQGHVNEIEKIAENDVRENILKTNNKDLPDWIEGNKKVRSEKALKVRNDKYTEAIDKSKQKVKAIKKNITDGLVYIQEDPAKAVKRAEESQAYELRFRLRDAARKAAEEVKDGVNNAKTEKLKNLKKIKVTKKAAIGTAIGVSAVGLGAAGVKAYKKKKESDKMEKSRKSVFGKK